MTAESPQPAASPPAAADTTPPSAQNGAAGNQQLRIVVLVVVAAVVAIGLWLALGHHSKPKPATRTPQASGPTTAPTVTAIGPVAQTKSQLMARASANGGQPFYWAGPKKGFHYEFQRLSNDNIYVRYLPKGVPAKGKPGKLLIIATYPMSHAYTRLIKGAGGRGVAGPHGSFVWVRTGAPQSVYVTWPHVPYEVEVYNPNPRKSARIAESGEVSPVPKF